MAGEAGDGWRWGLEMAGDGVKIRWGEMNGYVATVQSHMSKQVILTAETVHGLFPMMTASEIIASRCVRSVAIQGHVHVACCGE